MNERQVTVWSQKYGPEVHDGERDELDSWSDSYELKSDAPWFGADPVQFAVAVIQGEGCDIEPSSGPEWGGQGTWYSGEARQDYRDGTWLERSAHLHGFTDAEAREVYRQVTGREAEKETGA